MPYRQNFPIPAVIDPPKTCLCIEIPDHPDWKRVIAGNLAELQYWFNWERTGDTSGAQCAAVWKQVFNSIDWSVMSCCCDQNTLYRWTVVGVLQVSNDGGETYTDAPELDPRNNSPVYPPVEGDPSDDKSCIAASGMALLIEEQVGGNLTDDMSRYTLNQLIHDWVTTLVETSNPFEALMTIAANQIFALVIAAVRAALTDPVYAQLKCIFYDNILEDLSFDSDGWEAVRSEITSVIGGVAGIFLEHLVYLLGVVGLTNLARSQAATEGDCGSCDCLVDCVDTWIVFFGTALEMSGCNIQAASDLDGSHATIALDYDGTHGCRLDAVGVISGTFTGYTQYYLADGSGPFTNMLGFPTGLNLSNCTFVGNDSTPFSLSTDWSPIPP